MTLFPATSATRRRGAPLLPLALGSMFASAAIALVAYLLWPTWGTGPAKSPDKMPISIGGTVFNVPTAAIRMKIQRHSGAQERIDLDFLYPSLEAPEAPKHVSAEAADAAIQPIDKIFLSIAAHQGALAPEMRVSTIYPRYLEQSAAPPQDGLTTRSFRADTPYGNEDLFSAMSPALTARCTRDGATPGMCLSERRIESADLTFRFPRSWLANWRDVAQAMDRLSLQLRGSRN